MTSKNTNGNKKIACIVLVALLIFSPLSLLPVSADVQIDQQNGTWSYSFDGTEGIAASTNVTVANGDVTLLKASLTWVQTTKADFEAGILDTADTVSSPGDVKLNSSWPFVVLANDTVLLGNESLVNSGDVGANSESAGEPTVTIGEEVEVLSSSSKIKGDYLCLKKGVVVWGDVYYNDIYEGEDIEIHGSKHTPINLPVATLPDFPSFSAGSTDITVPGEGSQVLEKGDYGNIVIGNEATLIFSGGIYNVTSLDLDEKAKLYFQASSEVRIVGSLNTDKESEVGPQPGTGIDASNIVFYVAGDVEIGEENTIDANIYAPNGTVWLKKETLATGAYIGGIIKTGEEVVLTLNSAFFGYTNGTIASQVLDTGVKSANWTELNWSEKLQASTDITFEVRASDTSFNKNDSTPSWTSVGGTSPVTSGLPSGRYMQWRVTLTTSDTSKTPTLHDVTITYFHYQESGNLTSIEITPSSLASWDKFYANMTTPSGTNITFSILNATNTTLIGVINAAHAKNGYDISSIPITNTSIRLYAFLNTTNASNTPVLHDWNVSWATFAPAPLIITSFAPPSPASNNEGESRTFNIAINQTVNVSWLINGSEVQTNESVTGASYTNTSARMGYWNVSAIVSNGNGTNMQTWMWNVVKATYGVTLTAYQTKRSVQEGEDAKYTITIENTGNAPDTFDLTVINTSGTPDRVSLSRNTVSLSAGASDEVTLTINGGAGTYITTAKGTSTNDTSKNARITVMTEVSAAPVYGVGISTNVTSKSVEKNENAAYILTVENIGNQLDTFDLTLFSERGINASLSVTTVTLNSGESTYVILTVNGTTTGVYPTRVTASSQKSSRTETITLGTTILSTISLSVAPQYRAVTTTGNATYLLTVNNTGNVQHTYTLSASTHSNADSILNETTVTLNAGESASIELNVSSGTSGTYGVRVDVSTITAGGVLEEASIATTTTVNPAPVYGVSLSTSPTSSSVNAGVNAIYTHTVQNTGNQPDTFHLTLINPRAELPH